ncbi:DNA repair protein RadC [Ammoniphilus sp. CFH 90114]|uniref:RadC family protein n=1 Tax=Ammoniphilus sp. CFH 90114 TaxID=2493665 RepID=UPI00100DFD18|nr:DNA repair protein RadC [Ammoniphilus sp. CFH 90114]RXT08856.1 DNA repair protein RadC [Ammoniphilus sp. CFH 90114]
MKKITRKPQDEIVTSKQPAKRVNVVSIKMVKESSILYSKRAVRSPEDAYDLLKGFLEDADREHFLVVNLCSKNRPNAIHVCHVGSLNCSIVHPREVFKSAILSNSASIIVAHNHPSGDTTPSREDIEVTRRLKQAGEILGIDLLDHLIIGEDKFFSLKENGQL